MNLPARVVAVLAAAATLGGCGVGAQHLPKALNPKSVPYGLLGQHSRTSSPTSLPRFETTRVTLWLEGGNEQLVPVPTYVAWPATIGGLLDALAQGPTEAQSERGLVSPASSVGPLASERPRHGVVTVELPASFDHLGGSDQLIAAAQIVYTLTSFPGVKGVVFRVAGQRVNVPDAMGRLVAGPLARADYSSLTR